MADIQGYCVKCRTKKMMKGGEKVEMKRKGGAIGYAMKGPCETCGTTMFKILGKDEALKNAA